MSSYLPSISDFNSTVLAALAVPVVVVNSVYHVSLPRKAKRELVVSEEELQRDSLQSIQGVSQ